MKPTRYEPQIKSAIIAAVLAARKSGKKWSEALEVAKQAGYKGTEGGLYQLVNPAKPTKNPNAIKQVISTTPALVAAPSEVPVAKPAAVKPPVTKPAAVKPAAKPIAKAPAVKKAVVKAPSPQLATGPLDINALVHKAVTEAVVNALESLVASIKAGK